MIYIVVLIYTLFLFFRYNVKKVQKGERMHYYILLFITCAIAGFSYRLGMDTLGYMENFERLDDFNYVIHHLDEYRYEPAFTILLSLCKSIWNDFTLVQIVIAVFVNSVFFWFSRKFSNYYFLVIFLYFIFYYWNFNFEIKRESVALSFFLLGVAHILKQDVTKKDFIIYFIYAAICSLFHHFGVLSFLFPFVTRLRMNGVFYSVIIILFVMSMLGALYIRELLEGLNRLMALYTGDNINDYLESGKYGVGSVLTINGIITALLIPLFVFYNIKNKIDIRIFSFALFTIIISLLSANVFIFYRLQNYVCIFLFIAYARFAETCCFSKNKNSGFNRLVLLFIIFVVLFGKCHKTQYIRYSPYVSVFSKEIIPEREAEFDRLAVDYLNY